MSLRTVQNIFETKPLSFMGMPPLEEKGLTRDREGKIDRYVSSERGGEKQKKKDDNDSIKIEYDGQKALKTINKFDGGDWKSETVTIKSSDEKKLLEETRVHYEWKKGDWVKRSKSIEKYDKDERIVSRHTYDKDNKLIHEASFTYLKQTKKNEKGEKEAEVDTSDSTFIDYLDGKEIKRIILGYYKREDQREKYKEVEFYPDGKTKRYELNSFDRREAYYTKDGKLLWECVVASEINKDINTAKLYNSKGEIVIDASKKTIDLSKIDTYEVYEGLVELIRKGLKLSEKELKQAEEIGEKVAGIPELIKEIKKEYGIEIDLNPSSPDKDTVTTADVKNKKNVLEILRQELKKYPPDLFKKLKLTISPVSTVKSNEFSSFDRGMNILGLMAKEKIFIVSNGKQKEDEIAKTIHHELYHFLEFKKYGDMSENNKLWEGKGYKGNLVIKENGARIYNEYVNKLRELPAGYPNTYCLRNTDEHQAEISSDVFMGIKSRDDEETKFRTRIIEEFERWGMPKEYLAALQKGEVKDFNEWTAKQKK